MPEKESGLDPTIKIVDSTKQEDIAPAEDVLAKSAEELSSEGADVSTESSKEKSPDAAAGGSVSVMNQSEDNGENIDFSKLKKKKKKTSFKFGEVEDGAEPSEGRDEVEQTGSKVTSMQATSMANTGDDEDLDLTKMKKKKKKKISFNMADLGGSNNGEASETIEGDKGPVSKATAGGTAEPEAVVGEAVVAESGPAVVADDEDEDLDFNNMVKKKKKKKKVAFHEAVHGDEDEEQDRGNVSPENAGSTSRDAARAVDARGNEAWRGTDRDYLYEELLQRVFNIMLEKNPDMVAGDKRKLVMKPPQVLRVGTKKTSFANFLEISKALRRTPKHLQAFLMAELGTSGSIDANNQLIIKGRFQQKQIEHVLRRYIKEYVTCHTCRAPETIIEKDTRLNFLRCEKCGSRCSVQSIKSGFQAVTTKRAAIRAKQS